MRRMPLENARQIAINSVLGVSNTSAVAPPTCPDMMLGVVVNDGPVEEVGIGGGTVPFDLQLW